MTDAARPLDADAVFVVFAVDDTEGEVRILHVGAHPPEGVVIRLPR